jgi:D-tyrosyl-tRNA(Tyr) deacylase
MKSKTLQHSPESVANILAAVIQRVKSASVTVDGELISSIAKGLLVFAAIGKDDTLKEAESMAGKVLKTKFWDDEQGGKWKRNVQDIEGEVLCGKILSGGHPLQLAVSFTR